MADKRHVHQAFEEFAGRYIDGLFNGALFLNAGEEISAEDLVLWTLTGAFQEFQKMKGAGASEHWLEGKLVDVFLARTAAGEGLSGAPASGESLSLPDMADGLASLSLLLAVEEAARQGRRIVPSSEWVGGR